MPTKKTPKQPKKTEKALTREEQRSLAAKQAWVTRRQQKKEEA